MIYLTLVLLSWAVLLLLVLTYRRNWLRERDARLAIHRARILDNDQRSVDNERWAERVQQARDLAQLAEQPAEHVRNAQALLQSYREAWGGQYHDWDNGIVPPALVETLRAVETRLEKAIYWPNLEGRKP